MTPVMYSAGGKQILFIFHSTLGITLTLSPRKSLGEETREIDWVSE